MSDRLGAEAGGTTADQVGLWRRRLGVDAFRQRPPAGEWPDWLDAVRDRLGREADADIAEQVGVCGTTVGAWRRRLGIPAFRPQNRARDRP